MLSEEERLLAEQLAYYRARASEYDEWYLRERRYDRGDQHRQQWFGEIASLEEALAKARPGGDVLELACGSGFWTSRLAAAARSLTAVDGSPESLALNQSRGRGPHVTFVEADLFRWDPSATYDFIFFGFWLSHVPEARFEGFWRLVRKALRPSGKVFFVDSLPAPEATALDQGLGTAGVVERYFNDGRSFRVVKIFHQPAALQERLERLGWVAEVQATPTFFLHAALEPR